VVFRLLVIDNFDSFTYNLVQMFMAYPLDIRVYRSDALSPGEAAALSPHYLLISPGPKSPSHAGISIPLIRDLHRQIPVLGVCLGLQCMNEAFGGRTVRAPVPVHGKTSAVTHTAEGIFDGVPNPFKAARYHSLAAADISDALSVTAHSSDGVVMGLSHRHFPLHGVQFHPESFLTENGHRIIENFLQLGPLGAGE
jgi:anthranilate synthase component 2